MTVSLREYPQIAVAWGTPGARTERAYRMIGPDPSSAWYRLHVACRAGASVQFSCWYDGEQCGLLPYRQPRANGLVGTHHHREFTVRYFVNVEVALHRDGAWFLIVRGAGEGHAAGTLSNVGGTVEVSTPGGDVLELTARREVAEEIGVNLTSVPLRYVDNSFFTTDDGEPVVNVVFAARMPADAQPTAASADEVASLVWRTQAELEAEPSCPPWTLRSVQRAANALGDLTGGQGAAPTGFSLSESPPPSARRARGRPPGAARKGVAGWCAAKRRS
jgi:8-oxo-dGTP diphosphatase